MTYHCLTGRPPALGSPLPLRAFGLDLPDDLEELLSAALDPDPGRRPAVAGPFVTALRAGSDHLGRVGR
ncbi:hypothetical protein FrEUN1fDRAFT_1544 [Parafrankia sp. EUN1f]|nr:hypothetical protein FrEUN1fDRAFT_1544 [Parafrankia sp. EUN1f]